MAEKGWYPDPAGEQGTLRYWDGSSWTEATNSGDAAEPRDTPKRRHRESWTPIIIAAAIIVALAVLAFLALGSGENPVTPKRTSLEDTRSYQPTISAWDETSTPTEPPESELGTTIPCPINDAAGSRRSWFNSTLSSGGLTIDKISGWDGAGMYLQWVTDLESQTDDVAQSGSMRWMSNLAVGTVHAEDGFTDLATTARQSMECISSSGYYMQFTERVDLTNEATTVDGHDAWHMEAEVRVDIPDLPDIEGDLVHVYVVDTGQEGSFAIVFTATTIGDTARENQVNEALASMRVS